MGGGTWCSVNYTNSTATRASMGLPDFGYDDDIKTGRAVGVHPDLDPKKVAGPTSPFAGRPVRESRDSDEHPESLPIAMIFDVTGSMGGIPKTLQKKLAELMDVIKSKAGIVHPQVLVGAVGDLTCDTYPFQVGQFESDNRFDEQLRNIILEGGGGGQVMESYLLGYKFAADLTATDSFEKRGKKGYFFMIGDEKSWPRLTVAEVQRIFGIQAEKDESIQDLIARAQEKWEVFHLFANDGSYRDHAEIIGFWKDLLGERLVMVDDSSLTCEIVAGLIYSLETAKDIDSVLSDIGLSGSVRDTVRNAIVPVASAAMSRRVAEGSLPPDHVASA